MSQEIMAKWEVLVPVGAGMNIFTDGSIVHLPANFNKLFGRGASPYYVLINFLIARAMCLEKDWQAHEQRATRGLSRDLAHLPREQLV